MGFGKSFGLGLLLYILLNLGMSLVLKAVTDPTLIGGMFTLEGILSAMFVPILTGYTAFLSLLGATTLIGIFAALLLILPGLLGALVAGKSSDSGGAAFGGWLVAMIVVSVILVVLSLFLEPFKTLYGPIFIQVILCGVTEGFLWGGVAAASAGP